VARESLQFSSSFSEKSSRRRVIPQLDLEASVRTLSEFGWENIDLVEKVLDKVPEIGVVM
jgi:hypothetical protein